MQTSALKSMTVRAFSIFQMVLFAFFIMLYTGCQKETTEDELLGNWSRGPEFEGVGRTEAVLFTIGERLFVGGGYDGDKRVNDFWEFKQNTNTWIRIKDFPGEPRNSAVAFAVNGKGYYGTGINENGKRLNDIWEYDPILNSWTKKTDFPGTARINAVSFSINNKGYLCAGYDGNFLKDLWEYDAMADKWEQKASIPGSKRSEAVAFVHENKAYIVTGINNGLYLNDFWMYDPKANVWTEKRKISDATDASFDDNYKNEIRRSNAVIFVLRNKAYLTCGNRNGIIATTWEYDILNDIWKEKTGFEGSAREGALGFSLQNKGYILTGHNSSLHYDDVWEFFPDNKQNDDDN